MISRTQRAKKNIIQMFLIKGISIAISFLYIPLLLHGMNSENYGIWLTLTSIISWVSIFDIGLGNGLRNKLAISLAQNDYEKGKSYVSTAYICILGFVTCLLLIFLGIHQFVPWDSVLNAQSISTETLRTLVLIVFSTFCLQFSLGLLNSVLYAFQLPALSSFILMIGQLVAYIIVLILVKVFHTSSLLILGGTVSCIPASILLLSSLILYNHRKFRSIAPSFHYFKTCYIKEILGLGLKFFILQIITIILFQTNNFLITHVIDNKSVVEYNISFKYMHSLVMIFTIIAMPMWSATTEAYTKGEIDWIQRVNKKLQLIILGLSAIGFIMLLLSPVVYNIWLGKSDVYISFTTTSILYFYAVASMIYGCYGYILNGMGKLNLQIIITSIIALLYIPAAIYAGKYFGLNGILSIFLLSSIMNATWSKMQFSRIVSGLAKGIWNK